MFDLEFWTKSWALFTSAPVLFIALLLIASLIGWRFRAAIDKSQADGLRAQNDALKERLSLAQEKEAAITEKLKLAARYSQAASKGVSDIKMFIPESDRNRLLDSTSNTTAAISEIRNYTDELSKFLDPRPPFPQSESEYGAKPPDYLPDEKTIKRST